MKIIFSLLFVTLIQCAWGQFIELSQEEVKKKLCKTWFYYYDVADGKSNTLVPKLKQYDIVFKENETFSVVNGKNTTYGEWCYDRENKYISLFIRKSADLRIIALKDDEFRIILKNNASKNPKKHPKIYSGYQLR